ncbi:MAG: ATP-dependent Clp protease ATP-binding subunit [Eubacterium sp.]|nr:ATP-dependent Clp protease ATP-binding subunit [Eubacterium sp.]
MEFQGFTPKASEVLYGAVKIAMSFGHIYVGSEHILLGLLSVPKSVAAHALSSQGVTRPEVSDKIENTIGKGIPTKLSAKDLTPRSRQILEQALKEAKGQNKDSAGSEHLLRAIIKDSDCYAATVLRELGVNIGMLYNNCGKSGKQSLNDDVESMFGYGGNGPSSSDKGKTSLKKYGRELTALATQNKLDPVIFRDTEIDRMIGVLLRRRKNNPCLIGESGVGKTAVVEGLAIRIASGKVPENMKNKKIYMLDLSAMLAGAKYRGDFEERIKSTMDEIIGNREIILFIDELHTIIGAGAAEGAIDAANILKPLLARGEIQLIGATTNSEYRRHIEKDAALERRFQPITVEEPSEEATIHILTGLRERYEDHHNIIIPDEAIKAAVKLSVRYINDRFLPDKAIDLIDEAASAIRLSSFSANPEILEIEEKLKNIKVKKSEAINNQSFEQAAALRDCEKKLISEKEKLETINVSENRKNGSLTSENIAEIISKWTGIPVIKVEESEQEKLNNLEILLNQKVIGQSEAVSAVSKAIRRGRAGLKNPARPIGSFLFLGPTGVGKTELCKALALQLFGDESALIRLDMSEYMEKHAVSKLIGSPPGYIGYDEGGRLTDAIRRKPYSTVLFDEVEKAHPDVLNIMLQILEDGMLTSSDGRKTSFKNSVIIMTSNIGARQITENKNRLGFSAEDSSDPIKEKVLAELKITFRPEFINRFEEIIVFSKLSSDNIKEICIKMLNELSERAAQLNFTLNFNNDVAEKLSELGFDNLSGARPLRRVITSKIEDMLSQNLLNGKIKSGDKITVSIDNDEFVINFERDPQKSSKTNEKLKSL